MYKAFPIQQIKIGCRFQFVMLEKYQNMINQYDLPTMGISNCSFLIRII